MMADEMKELLLGLIGSITLADHLGDVAADVQHVLKMLGAPYDSLEWGALNELGPELGKLGVKTLYGTSLSDRDGDPDTRQRL